MKTVVEKSTGRARYLVEDFVELILSSNHIVVDGIKIYDLDVNSSEVFQDINPPADWESGKYLFKDNEWSQQPDWIDKGNFENMTKAEIDTLISKEPVVEEQPA